MDANSVNRRSHHEARRVLACPPLGLEAHDVVGRIQEAQVVLVSGDDRKAHVGLREFSKDYRHVHSGSDGLSHVLVIVLAPAEREVVVLVLAYLAVMELRIVVELDVGEELKHILASDANPLPWHIARSVEAEAGDGIVPFRPADAGLDVPDQLVHEALAVLEVQPRLAQPARLHPVHHAAAGGVQACGGAARRALGAHLGARAVSRGEVQHEAHVAPSVTLEELRIVGGEECHVSTS